MASVPSARAAYEGGADRLELNRALDRDGLSPSVATLRSVRSAVPLPVIVMIRPHDRGYVYAPRHLREMHAAVDALLEAGAAGVAVGCLHPDRTVDTELLGGFVKKAVDREVVFHRAFDEVADMDQALETLIDCGVTRVLTSGGQATALEGAEAVSRLVERADGRIEILPGAGVGPDNVAELLRRTGCTQVHGTFREAHDVSAETSSDPVAAVRRTIDALG